jgi:glycosyltransferase involved in cell wall biosynthesis/GT2 family glycosyltransferase
MIDPALPDYSNTPASPQRPQFRYRPCAAVGAPLVSILTPYFNTDAVFLETARSLLNQSCQDFEWIIVDDGSTDEQSLARLHATRQGDARIRVFNQENAGPAAARNFAFRNCSGRYICLLDSDDMLEPTFIEKCIWFLESNPDFGFCNSWSVNFGDEQFLWRTGFERGKAHLEANSGPPMSVIRRPAFEAAGGFDESIRLGHEDWDFWLALAKAGYWGHTLPEFQEWYRKRVSGRFSQLMNSGTVHRDFEARIAGKYSDLRSAFPAPAIRHPQPYESVPALLPFANRLERPQGTRGILFMVPWMVTGGADRVNLDWIAALARNGCRVTVCATLEAAHEWLPEFAKLTPDIFILPNFLRCADFPRFLHYLIESRGIDTVLITGSTFGYQVTPYLRSRCPQTTFVDLCHVVEPEWMNGSHPRFAVGYQDLLDLNLVTNAHVRDWMVSRGADPGRIEVCYTGIDVARLDATAAARQRARETLGLANDVPVIVFAGRLCEQKRPRFLVELLHALSVRGPDFRALIIGDGELREEVEARLRKAQLTQQVRMLGTVGHEDWLTALAAADIFLLPSGFEGISVALLEAMGMGVVPVTASVGGQGEVIDATCSVPIEPGTDELEAYVEALAGLIGDAPMRLRMGQASRSRILERFSSSATTAGFLAALDRARRLAATEPRAAIPSGFGQELATLAVEYTRLINVSGFLWQHWIKTGPNGKPAQLAVSLESLSRLLTLLGSTRLGAALLRSRRLRATVRRLLERLEAKQEATRRRHEDPNRRTSVLAGFFLGNRNSRPAQRSRTEIPRT